MKLITEIVKNLLMLLLLFFVSGSFKALGQIQLIKDINTGPVDSYGDNPEILSAGQLAYFVSNTHASGSEIWRTDGTESGTFLLKDINPGSEGSSPEQLTEVDGKLYFIALRDFSQGLWKSDGTREGTVKIADYVSNIFRANGAIYFKGTDGSGNPGLVKYDEVNGITLVSSAITKPIFNWVEGNGAAFFFERFTNNLWKTDGSPEGTIIIKHLYPLLDEFGNFPVSQPVSSNPGVTYFAATGNIGANIELWKSDGTEAGTVLVRDIAPFGYSSNPLNLTMVNDVLFFTAESVHSNGFFGRELWRSDGTEAGTVMVKDIHPGAGSSVLAEDGLKPLPYVNGTLFFAADDGIHGQELWKSDGTPEGTVLINDLVPGATGSSPQDLIVLNDVLYFRLSNHDNELWRSDGTAQGTWIVKDINSNGQANPSDLTVSNGTLYFYADDGVHGRELWKSEGTTIETVMVKDVGTGTQSSYPDAFIPSGGLQYFVANQFELWRSDGTPQGTFQVKNYEPGSELHLHFDRDGELIFSVYAENAYQLWKTNGSETGTILLAAGIKDLNQMTLVNSDIYFTASQSEYGQELWKYNTWSNQVSLISDMYAGIQGSDPVHLTNVNGALFFSADPGEGSGRELWKYDPENGMLAMVEDINPFDSGNPKNLTNLNGTLYFTAYTEEFGRELWKTDGTEAGTALVEDLAPGEDSSTPRNFDSVNGALYFVANTSEGEQLVKVDESGTLILTNFDSEIGSFDRFLSADIEGLLYFIANDGVHGKELWKTSGTQESTVLVKDLTEGASNTDFVELRNLDGRLIFTTADGRLWKSEGGICNTLPLTEISQSEINRISSSTIKGKLLLSGTNFESGFELFAYDFSTIETPGCTQFISGFEELPAKTFGEEPFILTATASSGLPVTYTSSNPQVAIVEGNIVTLTGAGDVTITASQEGDIDYFPATQIEQTLTVNRADATLAVTGLANVYNGNPKAVTVSTTPSGLQGVKIIYKQGTTVVDNPVSAGDYTVEVSLENNNYAAPSFTDVLTIVKAPQVIVFDSIPHKLYGDEFTLDAHASSGLTVRYLSSNENVATIDGDRVTIVGAGTAVITGFQDGNGNFDMATPVTQSLRVSKKPQSITFAELSEKYFGDSPFALQATSTSLLTINYSSSDPEVATVDNGTITIVGEGETMITASQSGNSEFEAAEEVTRTLVIKLITDVESDVKQSIKVYPNPVTDFITIKSDVNIEHSLPVLLDVNAKLQQADVQKVDGFTYRMDVSHLKPGFYCLQILGNNRIITRKIVKK